MTALPAPEALPAHPEPPDPLVTFGGQPVTTVADWEQRAAELSQLFQLLEYGAIPASTKVTPTVVREDKSALGGKATLREITLALARPEGAKINLLLVIPNKKGGPAPIFLGLNFYGNMALLADPLVAVPPRWKPKKDETAEQARGSEVDKWAIEATIDRGYAVASFWNSDVVPDDKEAAEAVLREMRNPVAKAVDASSLERRPSDTGTIAMWAWCLHRAVDYLVTNPEIDAKRIAVVGHSRNGKTALVAAAYDKRIALAIPSQSGCGGTAPARVSAELSKPNEKGRPTVETLTAINTSFPHWFCVNFRKFNAAPEKLPFDQHCLIALCAPRPVLLSNASEDLWANPAGQFEMLRLADPVYRLVARDGLGAQQMPAMSTLLPSRLGYFIRPGKHSMAREDWAAWLDYADKWLKP